MTVVVSVLTVCCPVVPSVTYQPLKWVIVGDTSVVLMYGWRVPRSAAVQLSPGRGAAVAAQQGGGGALDQAGIGARGGQLRFVVADPAKRLVGLPLGPRDRGVGVGAIQDRIDHARGDRHSCH